MTLGHPLSIRRVLEQAARQGGALVAVMAACNALFVLLALFPSPISGSAASSSALPAQASPLPAESYATYQLLLHVVSGFAAGAVSLDPAVALVGAGVGPSIDLDHLGFFSGLPVEARVGHSLLMVTLIVLLDSRMHFWRKGTRDLAIFVSLEYSLHLAVAPPGFPLLGPISSTVYYFPRAFPAALAALLAVWFLFDSRSSKRRDPLGAL
ncbi:MAG: hypothetical protein OK442_01605 [Thaumarchaeota archaeon]|nr:hypothetical protein [Nitrososphaerota archaeon]